jgi:hypothetical protein
LAKIKCRLEERRNEELSWPLGRKSSGDSRQGRLFQAKGKTAKPSEQRQLQFLGWYENSG